MKTREDLHNEAEDAYFSSEGFKKSIIMGTGTGKSKLAINIVRGILELAGPDVSSLGPEDILLLTNSERLRDYSWKDEFEKFGASDLWSKVVSECYQTAYRWRGKHFKIIIADEVDFALTEKYISALTENTCDHMLCLTGFCTTEKLELLNRIAPVVYRYDTQDAQDDNILNKTRFLLVEFDLSNERSVMVKKKDGSYFMQSEEAAYKYWEKEFQKAIIALTATEKEINEKSLLGTVSETLTKRAKAMGWAVKKAYTKRREILCSLKSARDVTKTLLKKIFENPENKTLVISELTEQCDAICKYTYHSKNKKDNDNIRKLNEGSIHSLGVVKAVNRGENLVGVNYIIQESYSGSETDFQQRHGRGMRLKPDQVLYYIILLPYYWDYAKVKEKDPTTGRIVEATKLVRLPTQAIKWFNKMTESFDLSNSRVIKITDHNALPTGETLTG